MNSSRISVAGLLAALVMCAPGIAAADGYWLFGGAIGTANVDDTVDGFRFDADSTSYRVYGGYQFNDYFALEAGYLNLGKFDALIQQGGNEIPVAADADGFTFAARGSIPLGDKFALHGSIGTFFWDGASLIGSINSNVSESNIFIGAAASFQLSANVALRIDASQYELDNVDASVFSLGFQVNFH